MYEVNLLVDTTAVGMVIGKGGEKLKQIRDETQGSIKVYQECLPESSERVVAIGGQDDEQLLAMLKMTLLILKDARSSIPHYYNPANKPSEIMGSGITGSGMSSMMNQHQGMGGYTNMANNMNQGAGVLGSHEQNATPDAFQELATVSHITVPHEMCGAIIGKSGIRIREIRGTSGAKIEFSESDKESKADRTISISGTQQQVNVAEQLMAQCVRNPNRTN